MGCSSLVACPLIYAYLNVFIDRTVHSNHFRHNLLILDTKLALREFWDNEIIPFLVVCPSFDIFLQGLWCSMWRNHVTVFVPSPQHVNPPASSHVGCAPAEGGLTSHCYCYNSVYAMIAASASFIALFLSIKAAVTCCSCCAHNIFADIQATSIILRIQ